MIERYSRKEFKAIWEDHNRYSIWLNIELAAAEAMEKLKIIPKGVVKKVKSKSKINLCNSWFYYFSFCSQRSLFIFSQNNYD